MHNWDYPKTEMRQDNEAWYLERLLLYGLGGEKIDRDVLAARMNELKIPENTRAFLELLLWNKPF